MRCTIAVLLFATICGMGPSQETDSIYVGAQVVMVAREAAVRDTPGFLSEAVASLSYHEIVLVVERQGDWVLIRWPIVNGDEDSREGWIHVSMVSLDATMGLAPSDEPSGTPSSREIALIGRGPPDMMRMEQEFAVELNLDFFRVDELESFVVPIEELRVFAGEGGLAWPDPFAEE